MNVDYYAILDVPRDATREQIQKAYRQAALRNHPDRGGEHAQMVLINEAYSVLRDAVLRAEYDRWLNTEAREESEWNAKTADVRSAAENYPAKWPEFEVWMGKFAADVQNASYGETKIGGSNMPSISMPTVSNSVSGAACYVLGVVLSVWLLGFVYGIYPSAFRTWVLRQRGAGVPADSLVKSAWSPFAKMLILCGPLAAGAWGGVYFHKWLKENCVNDQQGNQSAVSVPEPSPEKGFVQCPQCNQKLRVPKALGKLAVTCPKCRLQFDHVS